MRKLLALSSLAGFALVVVAGTPALAQEPGYTFKSKLGMTLGKAGAKGDARGMTLDGRLDFGNVWEVEVPVITAGRVLLPRGIVYNGDSHPKCLAATVRGDSGKGVQDCPQRSIMGRGATNVWVEVPSAARAVFINGGARRIWAYTTYFNPAFVQEPVAIRVERLTGPRWSYALEFEVPHDLQVIAGVPSLPPNFAFTIGGRSYASDYLATNGGCARRRVRHYVVSLDYRFYPDGPAGTSVDRGRLACDQP